MSNQLITETFFSKNKNAHGYLIKINLLNSLDSKEFLKIHTLSYANKIGINFRQMSLSHRFIANVVT
ncbi:hypothetical protein HYD58_03470 [Mycoplasmopsis bovis]|nr:hypothetical protein [Mycoplasmopsis bovis]QQH66164.1 hypothetical protein HYD58_03470 [Mycoplasmopsis bovis]